jgi:membrane fusion protein, multidrug efflux system
VQRRLYQEGTDVREGQLLFAIDPSQLRTQLAGAQAALSRAQATAANARSEVDRYEGLLPKQAISRQEYDTAVARLRTAEADVAQERARVDAARLALGYTTVTAPISGRASRAGHRRRARERGCRDAADHGRTDRSDLRQLLALEFRVAADPKRHHVRRVEVPSLGRIPARLVLEDGSVYPHAGHLNFVEQRIDESTGTASVRAAFPNPARALLPGQFVRISGSKEASAPRACSCRNVPSP